MAVTLAEGPSPALAGGDLTYTMTVNNNGPDSASFVEVDLPLAAGLSFISADSDTGQVSLAGGQVVASLGDLAPGAQALVTAVLQATAAGSITETATVTSQSFDADPSNNVSSVTTTVAPACDLAVTVSADNDVAAVGMQLDYTVTLTNNGPSDATGVVLNDTLPAGVTFVSDSTDQDATLAVSNGVVSLALDTLAAGDSAILVISVDPTAAPGSTLVDSANATGQQVDPNTANNTATLSTPVRGVSDLAVVSSVQPGSAYIGQPLTYTITVTNLGPADEPDAVLASNLPKGLLVDSTRSTQGGAPPVNQGILTADLGPLAAGDTAVVTLVATPGPADVGSLATAFSVQGLDYDPDLSDNTAYSTVAVAATSDLGVAIVPGNAPAVAQVELDLRRESHECRPLGRHRRRRDDPAAGRRAIRLGLGQPGGRPGAAGRRPHRRRGQHRFRRVGHDHDRHRSDAGRLGRLHPIGRAGRRAAIRPGRLE